MLRCAERRALVGEKEMAQPPWTKACDPEEISRGYLLMVRVDESFRARELFLVCVPLKFRETLIGQNDVREILRQPLVKKLAALK